MGRFPLQPHPRPELAQLVVYLAPESEVQSVCGIGSLACYGAARNLLIAPGDDPSSDISAEAVLTHEYGHHVAAHRSDAPWAAIDNGTKRWASYEQVCARTRSGELAPGAEQLPAYRHNPGEGFAETYRVLNERRAGLPEVPWDVVVQALYPDDTALARVEQDVLSPWQHATTLTRSGARSRTFAIATPLDGTLRLNVRSSARTSVTIASASGRTIARGGRTAAATICGERSVRIHVAAARSFRLTVARP